MPWKWVMAVWGGQRPGLKAGLGWRDTSAGSPAPITIHTKAGARPDFTPSSAPHQMEVGGGSDFCGLSHLIGKKDTELPPPTQGPCEGQMRKGKFSVSLGRLPGRGGAVWKGGHGARHSSPGALGQGLQKGLSPVHGHFCGSHRLQELSARLLVLVGGGQGRKKHRRDTQRCPAVRPSDFLHLQSRSVPPLPLSRPVHQGLFLGDSPVPISQHFLLSLGS